jgi:serine protease Do
MHEPNFSPTTPQSNANSNPTETEIPVSDFTPSVDVRAPEAISSQPNGVPPVEAISGFLSPTNGANSAPTANQSTLEASAAVAEPVVSRPPTVEWTELRPEPAPANFAPPPPLVTPPPPVTPPPSFHEPIAAEAPRAAALSPVTAMLAGGVLSCLLLGVGMLIGSRSSNIPADPMQQISGGWGGVNADSGNAIVKAVQLVGPAVMNVDTTFGKGKDPSIFLPDPGSPMQPREGKGTGVVIDSKRGLMLTNAHVVAGAQKIQVTTRDKKKYTGRLIGSDRYNDIALVELSNKNLPAAKLAPFKDAKDLRIGEWAIAIGNPYAQQNTVTVGVISAIGRTVGPAPMPGGSPGQMLHLTDMIQTDAAINPGNSGGPLCNIKGEVIGINTAIIPFATGLGFTIPINKAKAVADMLMANGGRVPYIGIEMLPVTAAIQKDFGMKDTNGALVKSIMPNSPAASAKIEPGDVIRSVDGKVIKDSEDVQRAVRGKKVGDVVKIDVLRNNTVKKTLSLKIGSRPE